MKKLLLPLALTLCLTGTAHAQRNVSLGLKAGGSYAAFTGDDVPNAKGRFGFHAGVFANIGLTRLFAIQPELLYSQKGSKYTTIDATDRLGYLDIPIGLRVNTKGLFFEAGPQVGILLSANRQFGSLSLENKGLYKDFDFGYLLGLGYQRKSGPGIGLRYNGSFTNISQSYAVGSATIQPQVRNSVFQLYLTYSFGGK